MSTTPNTSLNCSICARTFTYRVHLCCHAHRVHRDVVTETASTQAALPQSHMDDDVDVEHTHAVNDNSSSMCYDVHRYNEAFDDRTLPLFAIRLKLLQHFDSLPESVQLCVKFVSKMDFSEGDSERYYDNIVAHDVATGATASCSLAAAFPSRRLFHQYCCAYSKTCIIDSGWLPASIRLQRYKQNYNDCFRGPLALLTEVFNRSGGLISLIPFRVSRNGDNECVYSTS